MFRWIALATIVVAIQLGRGYDVVQTPPPGMLPQGTVIQATIYDGNGQPQTTPVTVQGYVLWYIPPREPEYYVEWPGYWAIWPQSMVDQYPH
jgi:hypothetical protein